MEIEFQTLEDLYHRLEPALRSKVCDLERNDYPSISTKEIWDYLANSKWKMASDLFLHQMVDDILHADNASIYQYIEKNKDR